MRLSWFLSGCTIIFSLSFGLLNFCCSVFLICIIKQESSPASTQEAYCPLRSKHTLCCSGGGRGVPTLGGGVPILGGGVPTRGGGYLP